MCGWDILRHWRSDSREWPTRMVLESIIWRRAAWIVGRVVVVFKRRSAVMPDHLQIGSIGKKGRGRGGVRGEVVEDWVGRFDELIVESVSLEID